MQPSLLPAAAFRLLVLGVGGWVVLGGTAATLPLILVVLLLLALAWADAASRVPDSEVATWPATLKQLLSPAVLPVYLRIPLAVGMAASEERRAESA